MNYYLRVTTVRIPLVVIALLVLPFSASGSGLAGNAVHFDGVDDLVWIADSSSLDLGYTATIELWICPDTSVTGERLRLVDKSDGLTVTSQRSFELSIGGNSSNGQGESVTPDFFSGQGDGWVTCNSDWTFQPNQWVHLAMTYDAIEGYASVFINGELRRTVTRTSGSYSTITDPILATDLPILLGYSTFGYNVGHTEAAFDGLMDEVRIWNTARSDSEIAASYNKIVAPSSTGLVGYYNFDEALADQHVFDATSFDNDGMLGDSLAISLDDPVRVTSTAPIVPEPATLSLLALGALSLFRRRPQ